MSGEHGLRPVHHRCLDELEGPLANAQLIPGGDLFERPRAGVVVLAQCRLRDVHHVSRCLLYGASVVTLPPAVFDKMYNHVLTDSGLAIFEKDFKEINS